MAGNEGIGNTVQPPVIQVDVGAADLAGYCSQENRSWYQIGDRDFSRLRRDTGSGYDRGVTARQGF